MAPIDRRDFVTGIVDEFAKRHDIADAVSLPIVIDFILTDLVAAEHQWAELQESDENRFGAELQTAFKVLNEYLAAVNHETSLVAASQSELRHIHELIVHKLEDKWGCNMYILRIC